LANRRGCIEQGLLLTGIAKDVRKAIPHILRNAEACGELFRDYKIIVVENGSSDGTKEFLRRWALEKTNRTHVEADSLSPIRSELNPRGANVPLLGAYRNLYLEHVSEEDQERYPFLCILDCDEVNVQPVDLKAISAGINFLSEEPDRAAIFANQRGFYYDIWALRHNVWCPSDCWQELRAWCEAGFSREAACTCIGSRQVHIPSTAPPIEVESAFGGLSIYKTAFVRDCKYRDLQQNGTVTCEHVSLHRQIRNRGGRLFIFPALMNSTPYTHILRSRDYVYWSTRFKETVGRKSPVFGKLLQAQHV
jgi:glycosyltransferase involved in cell wall biosynthesis